MPFFPRARALSFVLSAVALAAASPAAAQVSLTTIGSPYTQNFDTLVTTGTANTWTDNSTLAGWYSQFQSPPTNPTTYRADSGGSNTGAIYSWGVAGTNVLTERAFGSVSSGTPVTIFNAVRFVNNTGSPITSLSISYIGEQWRQGGCAPTPCTPAAQKLDFQYQVASAGVITDANAPTSGWVDANTLDFTTPQPGTSTAAAIDGNAAANRTALSDTISVSVANGQEVWIRWMDINDANNDHGLAIDDLSVTPNTSVVPANLSIANVTAAEGDSGTTTFSFFVTLDQAAPPAGVTFDIATADSTATVANNDYVAKSLTSQTITSGNSTYQFDVTVNGDTAVEANEKFVVNVTNVSGANVSDGSADGTITNDDVSVIAIHDVQGNGASSPLVGATVTVRGIVTGHKLNTAGTLVQGFFIQEPDASADADPNTSEGVLVFTGSAPPAAAAVGNYVQVTGTVTEFVPSADPQQPPLTEITSPTISLILAGQPLPAPITLTTTNPAPGGAFDQMEKYEGMRLKVSSMTVVAPTEGDVDEPTATATSTGVFYGVVTGVARPYREAGIQAPDVPLSGSIPPIPRFDTNSELIRVDSIGQPGASVVDVSTGTILANVTGPLDYTFRSYTILTDPGSPTGTSGGMTPTSISPVKNNQLTVAGMNVRRFFDKTDDAGSDVVIGAAAYNNRLAKTSLAIRNNLHYPDIIAFQEVEKINVLQDLAAQISADALAVTPVPDPDPLYVAYLLEGNDPGGIDVGYLIKTAQVLPSTPRVSVAGVFQEGAADVIVNPNASTSILNDRPTLRLMATVNFATGQTFPITVMNVHLRSLNNVDDNSAGSTGFATAGEKVRDKRQKQAASLASQINARQTNDPTERIIVLGDFNALEVNDGYGDSMSVIKGVAFPDNVTVVPGDGTDLVTPDLVELTPAFPENYSYTFVGNAQTLDHILVNTTLAGDAPLKIEHARINADFPESETGTPGSPVRISDHDPSVVFISAFESADLSITKTDSPDPVVAGTNITYTITASNAGPDAATSASVSDTIPAGTTFVSLASPGGWSCSTPSVGGTGTVSCTNPSMTIGSAVFTLVVKVNAGVTPGSNISNTATVSSSAFDPNLGNESATELTATTTTGGLVINDVSVTEGNSGTSTVTFTVTRLTDTAAVTFNYSIQAVAPGPGVFPATAGPDFVAATGSKTIPAGAAGATTTIVATVKGDLFEENDEAFAVVLSSPSSGLILDGTGIGTITNDDHVSVQIAASAFSDRLEGNNTGTTSFQFDAVRTGVSAEDINFNWTVTNGTTLASDFFAMSGTGTITAGGSSGKIGSFNVPVNRDNNREPDETFTVQVTAASRATTPSPTAVPITGGPAGGVIRNDDSAAISINNVSLAEGNSGTSFMTFTVTRNNASAYPTDFDWATSNVVGGADAADYVAVVGGAGTVPASASANATTTVSVTINGDLFSEANETFHVDLSTAHDSVGALTIGTGTGTGTITNDDALPKVTIDDPVSVDESAANLRFTVTLSAPSNLTATVTVLTQATPGTATPGPGPGADYTATGPQVLTFNPGVTTQYFDVPILPDTLDEPNETFRAHISAVTNSTLSGGKTDGTGTITDDDATPTVSIGNASVTEGNSGTVTMLFPVTLSAASGRTITVKASTSNGTATTANSDYVSSGLVTLTFNPGTSTQNFPVTVNGDTNLENNETLTVTLSAPANLDFTTGTHVATGTILNDDSPAVSIDDAQITEGDSGQAMLSFLVHIPSNAPTGGITFNVNTTDGSATTGDNDYTAVSGVGNGFIPAGQDHVYVDVPIKGDTNLEGHETFTVTISSPTSPAGIVTLLDPTATGTIFNDDSIAEGALKISEFRLNGANGDEDEYIEVVNTTPDAITVHTTDPDGTGFSVGAEGGSRVFRIPEGTMIPGGGHYLGRNSDGYSLGTYSGSGDATWTADLGDATGLALFSTDASANYAMEYRMDAVGFTTSPSLYKEGTGLTAISSTSQYAFVRKYASHGASIQDNDDNADPTVGDFVVVATDPTLISGSILGGPSPETLNTPNDLYGTLTMSSPDGDSQAYTPTTIPSSDPKAVEFRRLVSNSGAALGTVRFKLASLTTVGASTTGQAELRPVTSGSFSGSLLYNALTLQDVGYVTTTPACNGGTTPSCSSPSSDGTALNGGLNSTLGSVSVGALDSVGVNFRAEYQKGGTFFYWVVPQGK